MKKNKEEIDPIFRVCECGMKWKFGHKLNCPRLQEETNKSWNETYIREPEYQIIKNHLIRVN